MIRLHLSAHLNFTETKETPVAASVICNNTLEGR